MKEIILPSSAKVKIREGKGRDLINAQRIASTPEEVIYALMAELIEVDGKKVVFEDVLEMPLQDVLQIVSEIAGNFTLPPQGK